MKQLLKPEMYFYYGKNKCSAIPSKEFWILVHIFLFIVLIWQLVNTDHFLILEKSCVTTNRVLVCAPRSPTLNNYV